MTSNATSHRPGGPDLPETETLEECIATLVAAFQCSHSALDAWALARCTEMLCCHPHFAGSDEQRCAYVRLAKQWRWLARSRRAASQTADATHTEAG